MVKPDCYKCKHRQDVPGDAHSSCKHHSLDSISNSPELQLLGLLQGSGRAPSIPLNTTLNIKGSQHGIAKGWFNFPFNFDPVWLDNCDGFENKGE